MMKKIQLTIRDFNEFESSNAILLRNSSYCLAEEILLGLLKIFPLDPTVSPDTLSPQSPITPVPAAAIHQLETLIVD